MPHFRRSAPWALAVPLAVAALPASALAAGPPTVTTSPADSSVLTDSYALISGTINPNGTATSYVFQWGATSAYGQTTPVTPAGNGAAEVPVDYSLDHLKPLTTYHYRLVAFPTGSDPSTGIAGADETFRTTRSLALSIAAGKVDLAKTKRAAFTLKVVGPPDTTAQGLATVKALVGKKAQTVAIKSYSIDTGASKAFSVHLPYAVRTVLAAKHHPKVTLQVSARTKGLKAPTVKTVKVVG